MAKLEQKCNSGVDFRQQPGRWEAEVGERWRSGKNDRETTATIPLF
jgi:hypothetical protein